MIRQPISELLLVDCANPLGSHDVFGTYVDTFWLPLLGPGSICVARRLARLLVRHGGNAVRVDVRQLGLEVGMPGGHHRAKPVERCLYRLCAFGLATHDDPRFFVPLFWPTVPTHLLHRLPETLRSQARPPERSTVSVTRSPLAS